MPWPGGPQCATAFPQRCADWLIDGARKDIDQVLATRKRLPRISRPATQLKAVSL